MAIEPLGSMMTIQAQTMQRQPAQTQPVQKADAENTEVKAPEQPADVDATTASVARAQKQDGKKESGADYKEQQQNNNDRIKKAVEQLNKKMEHSEAVFGIHDETNRLTIKIIDKDTKDVLREYPPEKTLDMIAKVWELAGILIDEKR